jgi:hypothetical protein
MSPREFPRIRRVAAGAVLAIGFLAVSFGGAAAGGGAGALREPFYEETLRLSQAFGMDMIERRLALVEQYKPLNWQLLEQVRKIVQGDFGRFAGSLRVANSQLHADMFQALWKLIEAVGQGRDATAEIAAVRALLAAVRDVLIDPALQRSPQFQGAGLVDLLLAGDGVAEAFEEMFNEPWEYPNGYVALQRAKEQWGALAARASPATREEAAAAIAALERLYRSPQPPTDLRERGLAPEEAEAPAQRFAAQVEATVAADLFPGRDFVRLARHLHALTGKACAHYDNADEDLGDELILAVGHHYGNQLAALLDLIDPQLSAGIVELMAMLIDIDDLIESPAQDEKKRLALERRMAAAAAAAGMPFDDDDEEEATAPGWVVCPDLEFLLEVAIGKLAA